MVVLYELTAYFYQALSPIQRYEAMRHLHIGPMPGFLTNKWFVLLGWSLIGLLVILFFAVRRMRLEKERLAMEEQFLESSDLCRLTTQEREILETICQYADVPKKNYIFTNSSAFNTGFAKLIHESFEAGHNLMQRKQLNVIVQGIKTKVGFQKSPCVSGWTVRTSQNLSSRQIPQGRNVLVELISESGVFRFEATVIRNDAYELALLPDTAIEAIPGQTANVQYKVGAVAWVFETMVTSCGPQGLELNHSNQVKSVNRRRFPRVPVQKKAIVALFDVSETTDEPLEPPTFVNATVTEISGPGLRIQTNLDFKIQDRILIIFEAEPGRLIRDIAEVRGFRDTSTGRSVGVEMIGLNEIAVNNLIRITNAIAGTDVLLSPEGGTEEGSATPEEKGQLV